MELADSTAAWPPHPPAALPLQLPWLDESKLCASRNPGGRTIGQDGDGEHCCVREPDTASPPPPEPTTSTRPRCSGSPRHPPCWASVVSELTTPLLLTGRQLHLPADDQIAVTPAQPQVVAPLPPL
ncbi:hypothetical protein PVAP13_9NG318200 [Panicum virgatum]|uniref:Uncharacterized protein n=1 Tax=Panicum virgatum TaxID=38727 RepID=A0A8T0ML27_PANVG|nr:hypothetical protein PVAP13_9NG318200 [Panicum virgatum]